MAVPTLKLDELVIRRSRRKLLVLLLIGVTFVAMGIYFVIEEPGSGFAWITILFGGACTVAVAFQLFDERPRLVINDEGIMDRTLGVGVIPWTEIRGAQLRSISGNEFICLHLDHPQVFLDRLNPIRRAMTAANRAIGFGDLGLNLSGVAISGVELLEFIMKACEAKRASGGVS